MTGIDIVKAQIRLAQGARIGDARQRRARAGRDRRERVGDAVPGHHRGRREQLHPRLRAHQRLPGGHRLRHPPRRRHRLRRGGGHPVLRLAPGEGDGVGAHPRGVDRPDGPRAARVPDPRRQDQPAVPGGADRPPALPGRRLHHPLRRRDAGAVPVPAPPRPGHPAAVVHRRRAGERQPGGGGPAPARALRDAADPRGDAPAGRAHGHQGPAHRARARGVRPLDARRAAPAADRHDVPRRPPEPARHPVPHPRPAGPGGVLRPPPRRPAVARGLGRRDVRRGDAVPQGGPLGPPRRAARARAQRAAPDAAARLQRRRLHELPRQRRAVLRGPGRRRRRRPVPRVRLAQLGGEHARGDGRGARVRDAPGGGHLLHGRPHRPVAHQVRPGLLRADGAGARGGGRPHPRHQGHGGALQARGGARAGAGAPRGGGHPRPLPHPRHQRHRRRVGPGRRRGRR